MSVRCRVLEGSLCEITQSYKAGVHNGIDLVGKDYTLAWEVAHSDGTVVAVRNNCNGFENGSYGNYVKIRHDNGYYTLYGHMAYNTVRVSVGQRVSKGQVLGYMGNTGMSYGGHLHFEVRTPSDVRINPTEYLNADLPNSTPVPTKSLDEIAKDVIKGLYGNYPERKTKLEAEGYNYSLVQSKVNELLTPKKSTQEEDYLLILVKRTIRGDYGNGKQRKLNLGNYYEEVQRQVNLNYMNKTTNWDNIKLY